MPGSCRCDTSLHCPVLHRAASEPGAIDRRTYWAVPWPSSVKRNAEMASLVVMLAKGRLPSPDTPSGKSTRKRRGDLSAVSVLWPMWWWWFPELFLLRCLIPGSAWWPTALLSPKSLSQCWPHEWTKLSIIPNWGHYNPSRNYSVLVLDQYHSW